MIIPDNDLDLNLDDLSQAVEDIETQPDKEYLITEAIIQLHQSCDGAVSQDQIGFAGYHTHFGKRIGKKLENGGKLSLPEIEWAKSALPYYMHTQLTWLKKMDFDIGIYHARENALDRHRKQMFEQSIVENKIREMTTDKLKEYLKLIPIEKCDKRDQKFIRSLQNWQRGYTFSQLTWVETFLKRYWYYISEQIGDEQCKARKIQIR
ncbi:hypothetical protein LCGC14_2234680 [marine sediment metagenome]|uniref:Uncharacterized protein n=1 Tax=marine sediment metagenome TaxID=412755 RepID=A0A0F9FJR5_9ZZZZ